MNAKPPTKIRTAGNFYVFSHLVADHAAYRLSLGTDLFFVPLGDITPEGVANATVIEW